MNLKRIVILKPSFLIWKKIVTIIAFSFAASGAFAFDCAKAESSDEQFICSSGELKALVSEMTLVYEKGTLTLNDSSLRLLHFSQRQWLFRRKNACFVSHSFCDARTDGSISESCKKTIQCMADFLKNRTEVIEKFISENSSLIKPKAPSTVQLEDEKPSSSIVDVPKVISEVAESKTSKEKGLLTAKQIYSNNKDKILLVVGAGARDKVSIGSAVAVGGGFLATNCHVVKGVETLVVSDGTGTYPVLGYYPYNKVDLCLLYSNAFRSKGVRLAREKPSIGDKVYALGNPKGLTLTLTEGLVSAIRKHPDNGPMIQTSAMISEGSSGGALFNEQGELVGITTSGIREASGLNFAISVQTLKKSMEQRRIDSGPKPVDIFSENYP